MTLKATRTPIDHRPSYLAERVQHLKVGTTYSYKQLCDTLGCEMLTSKSKVAQRKVWNTYFTLETIGYSYKVVEIFNTLQLDKLFKEQHTTNSAKLLLNYFMEHKDTHRFTRVEKCPELIETFLFTSDILEICGYVPEQYRYDRRNLKDSKLSDRNPIREFLIAEGIDYCTLDVFLKEEYATSNEVRATLLDSLRSKKVIQHYRKELVRMVKSDFGKVKHPVALTNSEIAHHNLIKDNFFKELSNRGKGKIKNDFTMTVPERRELKKLLEENLGYSDILTGYYVAFTEATVLEELDAITTWESKVGNNEHFKTKLGKSLVKEVDSETKKLNNKIANDDSYFHPLLEMLYFGELRVGLTKTRLDALLTNFLTI